jgi:enoyl-CoA hydratase/carnithine racemase
MTAVMHCEVIQVVEEPWTANIFVICLDKPDSELNIIDMEFGIQLGRTLYLAKENADAGEIDLVVVCSAKESFVAGADILLQLKLIGVNGECK